MSSRNKFLITLIIALAIKIFLFVFAQIYAPQAKYQVDSEIYIQTADNLATHRAFTRVYNEDGSYSGELLRTPGYPLFLALLHGIFKIPFSGVIFIQVLLTILAALITYKTAKGIDPKLAYLSGLIILYDLPITIFSLMLLTETLFLFLISTFMFVFILYLKEQRFKFIILSALIITMATYVRPIAYFFAAAICVFMLYLLIRTGNKNIVIHILVLLITVYSLIGIWHIRNHRVGGKNTFSDVTLLAKTYRETIRDDTETTRLLPKAIYYLNAASRSVVKLMTTPGTLKNFNSKPLKRLGKITGYPWVAFWLIGFIFGISKIGKNLHLQFIIFVIIYFIAASVAGILFGVSSRQRVPMMPFVAIISSFGWIWLISLFKKSNKAGALSG
jgi:hypothetical protein